MKRMGTAAIPKSGPESIPEPILAYAALPPTGPSPRFRFTQAIVAAGMAAGLLLSRNLWLGARSYPLTPAADWLPAIRPPLDGAWFWAMLLLLAAIAVLPRPRGLVFLFTALAVLLALGDQSRWQPWFYQYLCMLLALGFNRVGSGGWGVGRRDDKDNRSINPPATPHPPLPTAHFPLPTPNVTDPLDPCRVIIAFTYLYSGLQKFNPGFRADTSPWLLQPIVRALPQSLGAALMSWRAAVPVVEALVGVGLLVNRVRPVAVVLAVAMHGLILWSIGPFGHNWNTVVWPWNLAMVAAVLTLFAGVGRLPLPRLLWGPPRAVYPKLVFALFGMMPAFSFVGRWDLYLSSALYSGNTPFSTLTFGPKAYDTLPESVRAECSPTWDGRYNLYLQSWSMAELNVPDYPAVRVHLHVARELSRRSGDEVVLSVRTGRGASADGERRFVFPADPPADETAPGH